MLFVLYGDDNVRLRKKYQGMLIAILAKRPELSTITLKREDINSGGIDEFIYMQGLFEKQYVVLIDGLLDDAYSKDIILAKVNELEASKNIFIILENNLDKETLSELEKATKRLQEFLMGKTVTKLQFNMFKLTDAFGGRDRGSLWVLYQQALFQK